MSIHYGMNVYIYTESYGQSYETLTNVGLIQACSQINIMNIKLKAAAITNNWKISKVSVITSFCKCQ